MDEEDKKWQAESDARTLIEYQKLIEDKKRVSKAKEELKNRKAIMKAYYKENNMKYTNEKNEDGLK